jgi:outer membrane protein assembly factor BamB
MSLGQTRNFLSTWLLILAFPLSHSRVDAQKNWPQFRGSDSAGIAEGQNLPDRWSATENVAWKCEIPGRGWSSPIIWGDRVFVTTVINAGPTEEPKKGLYFGGDRPKPSEAMHQWKVYCLDLKSGNIIWERQVHEGIPDSPIHLKSSYASETPVTDGKRVYCYFGNLGLFCFDLDGTELWQRKVDSRATRYGWGTAASPVLHEGRLYIVNDNDEDSYLLSLDSATGTEQWRTPRDEKSNWSTPLVWKNDHRTEIVTPGTGMVRSYDLRGNLLWSLKGMSSITIATPYEYKGLLYISSGYVMDQTKPIYAIKPGAAGDISLTNGSSSNEFIVWSQPKAAPYNPTSLIYNDRLHVLYDRGLVSCFKSDDGSEIYSPQRLPNGRAFTSSPWAYDGKIFCLNEDGVTFVLKADNRFEVLHTNSLAEDDMCMSTPAISGDRLLIRTAARIYCIQNPKPVADRETKVRFREAISAFLESDKSHPPGKGAILFIGSSIFRQWTGLQQQMNPLPVFNRAFGGSRTSDILDHMDSVVLPYEPKVIVYYCGSNDVNAGANAIEITENFKRFVDRVWAKLPKTRILYVSINRAPQKQSKWPIVDDANHQIQDFCGRDERLGFVDVNPALFDKQGNPRLDLYRDDRLHFLEPAYQEFTAILKPVVARVWEAVQPSGSTTQDASEEKELGTHGFAQSGDVRIHYVTQGEGPLVIMIHGFPDYWYTWRNQMPAIAKKFQVVAIDQRGYNQSDQPTGVENYSLDKLVEDVRNVILHFKREQAIIIGHDWGGMVAWQFAMAHPTMTDQLVILNLPHPNGLRRELAINPEQQKNSSYARLFQMPGAASMLKAETLVAWVKDPEARAKYVRAMQRSSMEGMLNYYKANYPREPYKLPEDAGPKVKCSVLMIHGLKDKALLPSALNDTWKWLEKDLTLVTVPESDHFVQQDASETVTRTIVNWLDR